MKTMVSTHRKGLILRWIGLVTNYEKMKKILKEIRRIISAIIGILRLILQMLLLIAIVACVIILILMATLADVGQRSFARISSALTKLVKSLGERLIGEKT